MPYGDVKPQEVQRKVREGLRCARPAGTSDAYYDICLACWAHARTDRPTFKDLQRTLVKQMAAINAPVRDLSAELAK